MEVKNQNLMFSKRASGKQDRNREKDPKRTYSVYPINRMKSTSPNKPNVANERLRMHKSCEDEPFQLSFSEDVSDENTQLPCHGLKSIKIEKKSFSSSTSSPRGTEKSAMDTLKSELSKCKRELNDYNNATKELEQKYMKINVELGELQQTHERFIANRTNEKEDESTDSCRDGSEFSLKRKCTHVFQRGKDKLMPVSGKSKDQIVNDSNCGSILRNKQKKSTVEFTYCQRPRQPPRKDAPSQSSSIQSRFSSNCRKFFRTPTSASSEMVHDKISSKARNLDDIYNAILQAMGSQPHNGKEIKLPSPKSVTATAFVENSNSFSGGNGDSESVELEKIIANLKDDQDRYRSVILEQQNCLQDYHARCRTAKQIMETQQNEIQKLTSNNKDLQNEVNKGIDQLRLKVDAKLRQVVPLTDRLSEEQSRYQKLAKENMVLKEHKRQLQNLVQDLKTKLDDLNKKKTLTMNRLKNAERDLRVFRNYNAALKQDKVKSAAELKKLKEKLDSLQDTHKRMLSRQRELNDKHCRELQRRVYDLEQRLGRSNNSTSNLLQDRDRLISELQTQINTLVHNFEVSQKHIRLLRRHLHNAAGDTGSTAPKAGAIINVTPLSALKRKSLLKNPL